MVIIILIIITIINCMIISSTKHATRTNYVKANIDKTQQNCKCMLCDDKDDTNNHIINKCSKLE